MQRPSRSVATLFCRSTLAVLFAGVVSGPLSAAESSELTDLISGLDAVELETRIEATRELAELGVPAVTPVAEAATNGSLEATRRAMEVLETMRESSDEQVQAAAVKALEKLASGDHRASARRAQAMLNPAAHLEATVDAPETAQVLLPGVNGNIRVAGGGQIQIAAGNGRVVQRIRFNNNGNGNLKKSIEVVEGQRRVQIEEQPGGITVTITTKKDGKEEKQVIQAPNAEALKKQNPEIHKIYEKFGGKAPANAQGAIQQRIQFRAQAVPGQAIPAQRIQIQRNVQAVPQQAVPGRAIPARPMPAQGLQNLPPQIQKQIQQRLQQQLKRAQQRQEEAEQQDAENVEEAPKE